MKKYYSLICLIIALFGTWSAKSQCGANTPMCEMVFTLHDSYGDGWNGARLEVYQNETLVASLTVPSNSSGCTEVVPLCADSVTLVWYKGNYDSEVSFEVSNIDGDELYQTYSASSFSTGEVIGVVYNSCPTCLPPTQIRAVDVKMHQMSLAWNPGSGNQWRIEYGPQDFILGSGVSLITADSNIVLTGLDPVTSYDIYLRTLCGSDDSSRQVKVTFNTAACDSLCPLSIVMIDDYGDGWNGNSGLWVASEGDSIFVNMPSGSRDTADIYMCPGDVRFYWQSGSYDSEDHFVVISSDGEVLFNSETCQNYVNGQLVTSVDHDCSACRRPANLKVVDGDTTTLVMSWRSTGATEYIVAIAPAFGDITPTEYSTTDTVYTFSNLLPDAQYRVSVRGICGIDTSRAATQVVSPAPRWTPIIYVDKYGGSYESGTSWANALSSLGLALEQSDIYYTFYRRRPDIWMAAGNYQLFSSNPSNADYVIRPGQNVYGGFVGNEPADYDLHQRDLISNQTNIYGGHNNYMFVQNVPFGADETAYWDGLYFYSGNANLGTLRDNFVLRNCHIVSSRGYNSVLVAECVSDNSQPSLQNCYILDNNTSESTLYLKNAKMENCLVSNNSTNMSIVELDSNAMMIHCDVVSNQSWEGGQAVYGSGRGTNIVRNSVIWNNECDSALAGSLVVDHTAVNGGYTGIGNIDLANTNTGDDALLNYPNFVDPRLTRDYRINLGSALIDAAVAGVSTDMDGNTRPYGSAPDMGCFENQGQDVCSNVAYLSLESVSSFHAMISWIGRAGESYELSYGPMNGSARQTIVCYADSCMQSNFGQDDIIQCKKSIGPLVGNTEYVVEFRKRCDFGLGNPRYLHFTTDCSAYIYGQDGPVGCDSLACPEPFEARRQVVITDQTIQMDLWFSGTPYSRCTPDGGLTWISARYTQDENDPFHWWVIFEGLNANTEYWVINRNICSSGDTSLGSANLITTHPSNLQRLYVKTDSFGLGDGSSWENAIGGLENALQQANELYALYGTVCDIWVAEGTYYGSTTTGEAFTLSLDNHIYGGFAGDEPEDYDLNLRNFVAHPTILDGDNARRVVTKLTSNDMSFALLDGFTIQNGYATEGACVKASSLELNHCIIRSGYATSNGGGVYLDNGIMENCLLYDNHASYGGGAYMYGGKVNHCDIVNNTALNYAAVRISGNNADTLQNSIFWGNVNTNGSAYLVYPTGSVIIANCAMDQSYYGTDIVRLAKLNDGESDSNYVRFADPQNRNYHLLPNSTCVDVAPARSGTDLAGNPSTYGDSSDYGCYEYSGERYCVPPSGLNVSNVNGFSAVVSCQTFLPSDTVVFEYALASDTQWVALQSVGGIAIITGLASDSQYLLRVRLVCGDDYSQYSTMLSFSTTCGGISGEIVLGDPNNITTTQGNLLPLNFYYGHTYTQTIVEAAELNAAASTISSMDVQYIYSTGGTRNVDIYLGHTQRSSFANGNDLEPASSFTMVYSGPLAFNNDNTWFTIPFQQSFAYNGTDNLVIAVIDHTGSYTSNSPHFATHSTPEYKTLYIYRDGTRYYMDSQYSMNRTNYRFNMRFPGECEPVTCPLPNVIPLETDDSHFRFMLISQGQAQVEYRRQGDDSYTSIAAADTMELSNLMHSSQYMVRARSICGVGDTSDWKTITFTTPIPNVTRIYVKPSASGTGDGLSWENATDNINWAVELASQIRSANGTKPQVWVAAGTYLGDQTSYYAFKMKDGVDVFGGFAGNEPNDYDLNLRDFATNATILDGVGQRRVLHHESTTYGLDSVRWDGFVIRNGFISSGGGGGVYMKDRSVLLNCEIRDCYASTSGGGVQSSGGTLINCKIINDSAKYGGGAYLENSTMVGCLVANNTASYGGGIDCGYSVNIVNSDIVANKIVNYSTSQPQSCSGVRSSYQTYFYNSVIWGNENGLLPSDTIQINTGNFYNTAVEGKLVNYEGVNRLIQLSSDNEDELFGPKFVRPSTAAGKGHADGDWSLRSGSLLIDRGMNTISSCPLPSHDLAGNNRLQNEVVDLGCYESDSVGLALPDFSDNILYVTTTGAGLMNGSSWDNAFDDINKAIRMIPLCDSVSIWVAQGTYYGDTLSESAFTFSSRTRLYGGFVGNESADFDLTQRDLKAHATVLDGRGQRRVLLQNSDGDSSYYNIIDGFVITNGFVDGSASHDGAGAYIKNYTNIRNCVFTENLVSGYVTNSGVALFVTANDLSYSTHPVTIENCRFENNRIGEGTNYAMGTAFLSDCFMSGCLFANNTASYYSAVYLSESEVENCTFVNNYSNYDGGVYLGYSGSRIKNCIIWGNRCGSVMSNVGGTIIDDYVFQNCAVEGGVRGTNNLLLSNNNLQDHLFAPHFVNPTAGAGYGFSGGDWRLAENSLCIGRGGSSANVLPYDLDGNARVRGDGIDIGCYESGYNKVLIPQVGNVIYVAENGTGDGSSWSNATGNLNQAIELAYYVTPHPMVWVASGTYYGDTIADVAFQMMEGVSVFGSMRGDELETYNPYQRIFTNQPNQVEPTSVLDGMHQRRVLAQQSGFVNETYWDGFVIQNGRSVNVNAAGVYLQNGGVLSNSIVRNNEVTIDSYQSSSIYGAGAYLNNRARLLNCEIYNNRFDGAYYYYSYGGGVSAMSNSIVEKCRIHNNVAYMGGGANLMGSVAIATTFADNTAEYYGGARIDESNIFNSLFAGNNAKYDGGGLGVVGSDVYLYNSNVVGNIVTSASTGAGIGGSSRYYHLINSLVWGNLTSPEYDMETPINRNLHTSTSYTNNAAIEGAEGFANNTINLASENDGLDPTKNYPRFAQPEYRDYRITSGSALVDNGDDYYVRDTMTTVDGRMRIQGSHVDIGCYESFDESFCLSPSNFKIARHVGTMAMLTWDAMENLPMELELQYRSEYQNSWTSILVGADARGYCLAELNPNTHYYVRLRSRCSDTVYSLFSSTREFDTYCDGGMDTVFSPACNGYRSYSYNYPFHYASYSYTQYIFLADELREFNGQIDSVIFFTRTDADLALNIDLYMGFTDKDRFDSKSDGIRQSDLSLVYSGPLTNLDSGKKGVPLEQPIAYDGGRNLVMAVALMNTSYQYTYVYNKGTTNYRTLYYTSSTPFNLSSLPDEANDLSSSVADVLFVTHHCEAVGCNAPLMIVSGVTDSSAEVRWYADSTVTLQYRRADETEYTDIIPTEEGSYTINGLTMASHYFVRINQLCDAGDSPWYETTFTTDIQPVTRLYVTPTGAGNQSGVSWSNAQKDLVAAINQGRILRERTGQPIDIWVAEGTYFGDTLGIESFVFYEGVNLYGGFVGTEPEDYDLSLRDLSAHLSILDGANINRVICQRNNFATPTYCDGFVIQNGYVQNRSGAGVRLKANSILRNCKIQYNTLAVTSGTFYGIGVYIDNDGNTDITQVDNCIIRGNANSGGQVYGGGISARNAVITNCQILNNNATYGAGLGLRYGVYGVNVFNSLIAGNSGNYSAGVYGENTNDTLFNVTVVHNTTSRGSSGAGVGGRAYAVINSIIWGNMFNYTPNNVSTNVNLYNCAVEGGAAGGTQVRELSHSNDGVSASEYYVRFVDPVRGDYHLHPASNCMDMGDSTYRHLPLDLDGSARIKGSNIDLGAYECSDSALCPSPINLRSVAITAHSVTLAWTPFGSETQWLVHVGNGSVGMDSVIFVSDTVVTVSGLELNRNYTFYVRALCGSGYSNNSPQLSVSTLCDSSILTPLPAVELISPVDSSIVFNRTINFNWSAISDATSYDLYVWDDENPEPTTPTRSGLTLSALNYDIQNYEYGHYYHWRLVAWKECINRSSEVYTFQANPLPDLHVTQVSYSNPVANQPMTITWTVRNDGEGMTPPGSTWVDHIWLVSDVDVRLYDNNDRLGHLADVDNMQSLGPGESYTNSVTVIVPQNFIGNYYLFAFADQTDAYSIDFSETNGIAPDPYTPNVSGDPYHYFSGSVHASGHLKEVAENDNFFYRSVTILPPPSPDLYVSHMSHPINAFSNTTVSFQWTVTNQGSSDANGNWVDRVYLQEGDGDFDLGVAWLLDTLEHRGGLGIDSSYSVSMNVKIPIHFSGNYYFRVITDARDNVYESVYESNNISMSSQAIDVIMAPLADLEVQSIRFPDTVSPGCSYSIASTIRNVGNAPTEKLQWYDAAYLSTDSILNTSLDILLDTISYNRFEMLPLYKVNSSVPNGFYRSELVYPALAVDSSYSQFNLTEIGMPYYYHGLEQFYHRFNVRYRDVMMTIPRNLEGNYYIIVCADVRGEVFENTNTANNVMAKPVYISTPDLVVASLVPDSVIEYDANLNVNAYIKNIGEGYAKGYLYNKLFVDDTFVVKGVYAEIASGDSILVNFNIPKRCISGTHGRVWLQTNCQYNGNDVIYEGSHPANNISSEVTYQVLKSDPVANAVTYTDSALSGQPIDVSFMVTNQGTCMLHESTKCQIFISESPVSCIQTQRFCVHSSSLATYLLKPDSSQSFTVQANLPNGIHGQYYLHVVIDPNNELCELDETNNVTLSSRPLHVSLSPYPDFVVRNIQLPDTMSVGQVVPIEFDIVNQGIANARGNLVSEIFMSASAVDVPDQRVSLAIYQSNINLNVGDTQSAIVSCLIPTNTAAGNYYFYVITDFTDNYYEYNYESNNISRSARHFVKYYPLDLAVDSIVGPDTVEWGQLVSYDVYFSNHSEVVSPSSNFMVNKLLLTPDGIVQSDNVEGVMVGHNNYYSEIIPGSGFHLKYTLTIPYGNEGSMYLVGVCDYTRVVPDVNLLNNQLLKPIYVRTVATPDLEISNLQVLGPVLGGQLMTLAYDVTNIGSAPVRNDSHTDKFFLSANSVYDNSDIQIGTSSNNFVAPGDTVHDTVDVRVPLPFNGNMYVIANINAYGSYHEVVRTNNIASVPVNIILPPPGDLYVSQVSCPDSILSGKLVSFDWKISNIGQNAISGSGLSSLVYLSADNTFSSDDRLLGTVSTTQINMAAGDTISQHLTTRVSGLSEGRYYLIVKTDVRNSFYEDNEDNNTTVSAQPITFCLRELPFNTPLRDTVFADVASDYKLVVGREHRNETVRLYVNSDDSTQGAVNTIYVSPNMIGNNLSYTYSSIGQYTANPELYIPATRHDYYGVSVYGTVPNRASQVVTIEADILPFEINGITPNYGGNSGSVTVELTGSHFRPDMRVWLARGDDTVFADTLIYSSLYQSFARFNLEGADTGRYSVGVVNYCEGEGVLRDAFHVVSPEPTDISYNMVFPHSPRNNRTINMMLEFGNIGTNDLQNVVLEVQSVANSPISLTPEGLNDENYTLTIPLSIPGEPNGLIRPGAYGTINIYGFTKGGLVFAIRRVR